MTVEDTGMTPQEIMQTKITIACNGKPLVGFSAAGNAANWLRNHKQTDNGKAYEKL